MKKTQLKMMVRGVKKSLNRFLSILGIVALGVGFLAGLVSTTPDMNDTTDGYFDSYNTYDINIKGSLGLTEDDLAALKKLDYIETAETACVSDFIMTGDDDEPLVARLYGIFDENGESKLNHLKLIDGRMPEKPGECVLLIPKNFTGEKTYDTISISPDTPDYENIADTLAITEYTIVGHVESPLFISIETEVSTVGSGSVANVLFGHKSIYSLEVSTDIFATVSGASALNSLNDEYTDLLSQAANRLESVGEQQSEQRYSEIVSDAKSEIDEAKKELNDKKAEVYAELNDAYTQINDAERQISDFETQLANALKSINDNENILSGLRKSLSELHANVAQSAAAAEQLRPTVEQLQQIIANGGQLDYQQQHLYDNYVQLTAFLSGAPQMENQLSANISALEQGIADGRRQYNNGMAELEANKQKLADSRADYNSARAEADAEFADAEQEIADAEQELSNLKHPEWYIFDRTDNAGFNSYKSNATKVDAVAKVFPAFFFLVAILVALTTMTRLVDEDRIQIGTLKSLGYSNSRVLGYYLMYGGLASLLGTVIGLCVGFVIFPKIISNAYGMMFSIPIAETPFRWAVALPVGIGTIIVILFTTYLACRKTLAEQSASLLLPRAPSAGKRIFLERISFIWKRMSFMHKVTARNLFRYKKRFLMTIIGVAGCSALLLTGFGIRDSINSIVDKQFGEINKYNLLMRIEETADLQSDQELYDFLQNKDMIDGYLPGYTESVNIDAGSESSQLSIFVPQNPDMLSDFIALRDRKSGEPVEFGENSAVITEKLAGILGVGAGDTIEVRMADNSTCSFTLTGVTENYVSSYLYLGESAYLKQVDTTLAYNELLVSTNEDSGISADETAEAALKVGGVTYCLFSDTVRESFNNTVKSIDYVVMVLILSAGLLSIIVIYNLTNVNICERKKELATLKVLGFYEHETALYIFRETNILSVIGTALGLVGGIWLHMFVITTIEVDAVMFGREIFLSSFLLAALISIGFALLVDIIMMKSITSIDMVEAMKAND